MNKNYGNNYYSNNNDEYAENYDIAGGIRLILKRIEEIESTQRRIIEQIEEIKSVMNLKSQSDSSDLSESEPVSSILSSKKYTPYVPLNPTWSKAEKTENENMNENINESINENREFQGVKDFQTTDKIGTRDHIKEYFDPFGNKNMEIEKNYFKNNSNMLSFEELKEKTNTRSEKFPIGGEPFESLHQSEKFVGNDAEKSDIFNKNISKKENDYINLPKKIENKKEELKKMYINSSPKKHYYTDDDDTDYNSDCEYIIAEKGKPASKRVSAKTYEKVIEKEDEDTEIYM